MEGNFGSSQLGTKEYWDNVYGDELENYSDHGNEGEIWFGDSVVKRVTNWLGRKYGRTTIDGVQRQVSVLDIGTGNGMFLIELSKLGFTNLTGVDYSESAIKLAKLISNHYNHSLIVFQVGNLLETTAHQCGALKSTYDVCTDKGTFDAVSLDPDDAEAKKKIYVKRVSDLLFCDGLLVLTSCNWTKDELVLQFNGEFEFFEEIPMLQFQFGGRTGQQVTSIVFKKKLK